MWRTAPAADAARTEMGWRNIAIKAAWFAHTPHCVPDVCVEQADKMKTSVVSKAS